MIDGLVKFSRGKVEKPWAEKLIKKQQSKKERVNVAYSKEIGILGGKTWEARTFIDSMILDGELLLRRALVSSRYLL